MTRTCVSARSAVSTETNCRAVVPSVGRLRAGCATIGAATVSTRSDALNSRSFAKPALRSASDVGLRMTVMSGPHHVFAAFVLRLEDGEESRRLENDAREQ